MDYVNNYVVYNYVLLNRQRFQDPSPSSWTGISVTSSASYNTPTVGLGHEKTTRPRRENCSENFTMNVSDGTPVGVFLDAFLYQPVA